MKNRFTSLFATLLAGCFIMVAMLNQAHAQTYCTPSNSSNTSYGINTVKSNGGLTNFQNLNSGFSANGYGNFTAIADTVTQMQGQTFTILASSLGSYSCHWGVWVDWNQDGDFSDAGEEVFLDNGTYSTNMTTNSIVIPYSSVPGYTRIRVIANESGNVTGPCMTGSYIEAEDYTLNILAAPACAGQPTAGGINKTDTFGICSGVAFSLTDTGATAASGMTYQWQQRTPSGTGTWTDIPGATAFTLNFPAGITSATDYRFYVVCNAAALSDTSAAVTANLNPPNLCYCIPYNNYSTSYYISEFKTTGAIQDIDNTSSFSAGGYADYTGSDTIIIYTGMSFDASIQVGLSSTYYFYTWIDWNQDGDFDDPGETVLNSNGYIQAPYTGTITIPSTATTGFTRLRVRNSYIGSTASCGSSDYGEAEDYTLWIKPLPACDSTSLPANLTATVDNDTLCVSGDVHLDFDTTIYIGGLTYQWQKSSNGTSGWTNVGAAQDTQDVMVTGVNSDTWFRCQITCSANTANNVTSNILHVHINNPQLTGTPQGGTRCGPGTVTLTGSASSGSSVSWYESPVVGGMPFATGPSVQSPYIVQTDTFWAAAGNGSSADSAWIGTGTSTTTGEPNPFYTTWMGNKVQILIKASELQAAGFSAGAITKIGFDVQSVSTTLDLTNFTIKIGETSVNALTTTFESGLTTVYTNPAYTVQANTINTFVFTNPFPWDGVSNIVIETCFANNDWNGSQSITYTSGLSFNASHYNYEDNNPNHCTSPTGSDYTSTSRPNVQVGMLIGCEGGREPVVAVVTPGPAFSIGYDSVICNNTPRPITVTSALSNYTDGYTWTVLDTTGELYTNASGTIPYVSGTNASTVYFKSTVSGWHRIAVHASNGPLQSDCAAADTADIWVQPGNITIDGMPDTICVSGTSELTLNPDNNYWPGTIQWQESANGTNYNNLPGETNVSYTTVTLSTAHYYRAIVSAVAGVCETPVKHLVIANPVLLGVQNGSHCGPGSVVLHGTPGQNTNVRWYDQPDGGNTLGIGNTFNTPFLTATDTFYAAAGVGQGGGGGSDTLTAGTSGGNGCGGGVMFDITPTTSVNIDSFAAATYSTGSNVKIYYRVGSYSGNETNQAAWTLLADVNMNYGSNQTINIPLPSSLNLTSGTTYGFYINYYAEYTTGAQTFTNADMTLDAGVGLCSDFGGVNDPRYFNGRVYYHKGSGCESPRQMVVATINPKPEVDLGPDINECVDSAAAIVLNAGVQPNNAQFLWNTTTTNQVLSVNQSGTYYVTVTNSYNCSTTDTINVTLRHNPEVTLPDDTSVCLNTSATLDAGPNGIQYFWNTGATTRKITVNTPGVYTVLVTGSEGCIVGDTVTVDMSGNLPHYDGIQITNDGVMTFKFNALNPQDVIGYYWSFGDGGHSQDSVPVHTYLHDGNYVVTLDVMSACGGYVDSTSAHILGIGQVDLSNDQLAIYPNPTREKATIETKGVKMERVVIYNVLGQKIYEAPADSPYKHVLDLKSVASGVYNITVYTEKGMVNRKLNVIK